MQLIAAQLRKPDLSPPQFTKLVNLQAKLSGWKTTQQPESKEQTLDQLVREAERKRRTESQSTKTEEK